MKLRELRSWVSDLNSDDNIEVINGNTLTAARNGILIASLPVGGMSFKDYRRQCYKEFKGGVTPHGDFFKPESAL